MFKYSQGFEFISQGDRGRVVERHETLSGPRYVVEWHAGALHSEYDEPTLEMIVKDEVAP